MSKPRKAAIYARVSTTDQDPDAQLLALREYAAQRGFIVHKEYVDYVSGDFTKRQGQRLKDVAYQEMMDDVNHRIVDCVIVWKYDRFARSLSVLISTLQQFNSLGVDFISYTQHIDTTTPMGRLFFHIIGSFAEFEWEMIGERVRAGLAKVRAQGKTLGPPIRDRDAGARIQALRDQGFSLREIARREGYSPAGVLKILRRSKV
jgi:DNA invertase Pin-like site-specific DNA recombinase